MIKRIYHLLGQVTREDIEFLTRAKVDFYREPENPWYQEHDGVNYRVTMANPKTIITVRSDNKVTWLKLNFGDRLLLISEEFEYKYY